MPIAAHLGDLTTNAHGCTTSVPIDDETHLVANTALAAGVTIQGNPAAVVGSILTDHTIMVSGSCVPHGDPGSQKVTSGSSTVKVGGKPLAYQGATVSCPGTITGAAGTVSVGA
ncbi:MAG: hypothetical protein CBB67_005915 [Alteromonadaceae bacterium TMED7]|uniref:PAAR domain-containing protein n=1 Tax=Alteromonas sp. TaxID=232 RepID=UPI000B64979B|nr:hypothetical protein [Alteromonas sp.]RPH20499.1 MAG: hypothetical protein CBB67_005915 [Alteromonadaceae bacterium TMED7]|tara:strand:- start:17427 stop:17768 length:342 start_codon:yes stop_codon:yes gene_type:complete